jgi:hypothetical protein
MSKVMVLNKGRKRKLRDIQWTRSEKVSAAALILFLGGFCIAVAFWMASVDPTDSQEPSVEIRR